MLNRAELLALLTSEWGSESKQHPETLPPIPPQIRDLVGWDDLETDAKALVLEVQGESGGCLGSVYFDPDSFWCLENLAKDLHGRCRYKSPVPSALIRALSLISLGPGEEYAAVAAPYLFSELERLLRMRCSPHVRYDGMIQTDDPERLLGKPRLRKGNRMNSLADAYTLSQMLHSDSIRFSLVEFDRRFQKRRVKLIEPDAPLPTAPSGVTGHFNEVSHLHSYLWEMRNAIMHGTMSSLTTEGHFLSMLIGVFIVNAYGHE